MDERKFGGFSRKLPSPEELFHSDEWEKQEQSRKGIEVSEQKAELPWEKKEASAPVQKEALSVHRKTEKTDAGAADKQEEKNQEALAIQRQEETGEDVRAEGTDNKQEQVLAEEPVSKRKKSKVFPAGFIIGLLVLALIITNLGFFHVHLFCMTSESMGDVIPKGSVIISYEVPAEKLETGDVITYMSCDGVLDTHEIISVIGNYDGNGSYAFRTKGAGNAPEDEEAVTYGMVKGKALIYIPYIGKPFVK